MSASGSRPYDIYSTDTLAMINFCNDFEKLIRILLVGRFHAKVQPVLPRFALHFVLHRPLATI